MTRTHRKATDTDERLYTVPDAFDAGGPFKQVKTFAAPTDEERTLMATLAIEFANGAYRFDGFRYDGLSDAVNYAKLTLQRKGD